MTNDPRAAHDGAPSSASPRVLACALDPRQQSRLAAALRGRALIESVETFRQLGDVLCEPPHVAAVVVAARDPGGEPARRVVREIAAAWPRMAIVVYCHDGWRLDTDIRALAASGAHQFVFDGVNDDVLGMRAALSSARRQSAAEGVMRLLAPIVPPALHPVVEAALARADAITDVGTLAAALGVHRKTLFNMCKRAAFLSPAELLAWVRLTLVAYLLETTGRTIDRVALELSYPSPTALRNTFRRYVGRPAQQVRSDDGVRAVLDALRRRVGATETDSGGLHVV